MADVYDKIGCFLVTDVGFAYPLAQKVLHPSGCKSEMIPRTYRGS